MKIPKFKAFPYVEQTFQYCPFSEYALSDLPFLGTIDLVGEDEQERLWVTDHKALRMMPTNQRQLVITDFQCNFYMDMLAKCTGRKIGGVVYNVAIKPTIKQKQSETPDEYLDRARQEYTDHPEKYFKRVVLEYTPTRVERIMNQVRLHSTRLLDFHDGLQWDEEYTDKSYLDHSENVKCDFSRCFEYGKAYGCAFRNLCEYDRVGKFDKTMVQYKHRSDKPRGEIIYA
jgi:hypothetical protein